MKTTEQRYKQYVLGLRNDVVSKFNKLLKGNISVAQAHTEREEIVDIFNMLADELQEANDERARAMMDLRRTQYELRMLTEKNN